MFAYLLMFSAIFETSQFDGNSRMTLRVRTYKKFALALVMAFATGAGPALAESLVSAVRSAVTSNPAAQVSKADVRATLFELLELLAFSV